MEYRKLIFGTSAAHTNLAIDDELGLIAVASEDGSIKIYSQISETSHSFNTGVVSNLKFIKGKGTLVALDVETKIHVIETLDIHEPCKYPYNILDNGSNISYIYVCQHLALKITDLPYIPFLTSNFDNEIELIFINKFNLVRTKKVIVREPSDNITNKILQMTEIDYKNENVTVLILWNDIIQIVKFTCNWNDVEDTSSAFFDFDHIVSSYVNVEEIINMEVMNENSFLVTTSRGMYGIMHFNDKDHLRLVKEDLMFPYGPFPCKAIRKCERSFIPGFKDICYIFSGGLPSVTYKDFNTVSVAVKDEPEICFTFYDSIVDFHVIRQKSISQDFVNSQLEKIIVLTTTQLIFIINNKGVWESTINCDFSTVSKTEVMTISNTIKMESECHIENFQEKSDSLEDANLCSRLFATFHKDTTLSVWNIAHDKCYKYLDIYLGSFFKETALKKEERKIFWPKFQKCGFWKNHNIDEKVSINSLKLLSNDKESFNLILSMNDSIIFYFKILYDSQNNENSQIIYTKDSCKYITINYNESYNPNLDERKINDEVHGIPSNVELRALILFKEVIDIFEVFINDSIISFGGSIGVGLVDIVTGTCFYISSEDLVELDQTKGRLSEFIQTRLRRRKSFESSNLKRIMESKSPKNNLKRKIPKITSFLLYPQDENKYDLIIGFSNGQIIILSLKMEDNGEINISTNYKMISSRSKDPVISLCIISDNQRALSLSSMKPNLEDYKKFWKSVDSSKEGSLSAESKSTHKSSDSCQISSDLYPVKSKSVSLKSPSIEERSKGCELLLMKCDKESIKMIDYIKLKTRFKYKIKEQLKKSEEINENIKRQKIIQVKYLKGNHFRTDSLIILCSEMFVLRLSIPLLLQLDSENMEENIFDMKLLSLNDDNIIIARNIFFNQDVISQFMFLDKRKKLESERKGEKKFLKNQENKEIESPKREISQEKIDFMKCAESSLNSLLW